jgi:hypothetical protein
MSKTRNNHYVPQWYQEGFFEPGKNTLAYLDLAPKRETLADGRMIKHRDLFDAPTSRAFHQYDLYSTFFGTSVNDEIERFLFGDIDGRGSQAIRAYAATDVSEWHHHFQTLFEYIDIQKLRTPKGLEWLKAQYPSLTQNELMFEMQGIRTMHCTFWTEGVREIVSAEDSEVKFLVSDHPVTVYNHAAAPDTSMCQDPDDPSIALKASQTIFPLTRDFCLILTNLEYAQDPATSPLEKRTFARNFRSSMVRTDAFIRERKLSAVEVTRLNKIIKSRAKRYIAAGRKEWLYPEHVVQTPWADMRHTLLPPKHELYRFGGEIFVRYEDGHVHYQDQFGRTEKPREFLVKKLPGKPLRSQDMCGCGSGFSFGDCCKDRPTALRPAWDEASIRERNLMLHNAIVNVLKLKDGRDWTTVRREMTDEQIGEIYHLFEGLWPLETDILRLLPKPDGKPRAVYTGSIHPSVITDFAIGASLYFGQILIQHPFVHAGIIRPEYSPVKNPKIYRQEFLKAVVFFFKVLPLVERGLINLVPDPGYFNGHLREQTLSMAKLRAGQIKITSRDTARMRRLARDDFQRSLLSLSPDALRSQLTRSGAPRPDNVSMDDVMRYIERLKDDDPLAVLQDGSLDGGKDGGQFDVLKLVPNFEMTMYLAQATGSCIVTDDRFRWAEILRTVSRRGDGRSAVPALVRNLAASMFQFPQWADDIGALDSNGILCAYPGLIGSLSKYLSKIDTNGRKPNVEANIAARFSRLHEQAQKSVQKARIPTKLAQVSCQAPVVGIQDNTINRLLLMSSAEHYLPNVSMAFFIEERPDDR